MNRLSRTSQALVRVATVVPLLLGILTVAKVARAQYYYPPPPPPPPPPGAAYGPAYGYPQYEAARPPEATNRFDLGFDGEGAFPVNLPTFADGTRLQGGSGFKLRLGDRIAVAPYLHFTPEVGWAYEHLFAANDYADAYDWDTSRLFAGARLSFGRFVEPSVYAHVGVGWRSTGDPNIASTSGFAGDVGGALDLRFWRRFLLGAHLEYASIDAGPYAPTWVALGIHGDVVF